MPVKAAVIAIAAASTAIITAACYCRGCWAAGAEWAVPAILAAVVPVKERREKHDHED